MRQWAGQNMASRGKGKNELVIELNKAHIEVDENSVQFHDDEAEDVRELTWVELYGLVRRYHD